MDVEIMSNGDIWGLNYYGQEDLMGSSQVNEIYLQDPLTTST